MQYDYQVTWIGQQNQTLSLGGRSFISGRPMYFTDSNLPLQLKELKNLPGVSVVEGMFIDPETVNVSESTSRIPGIVWKGSSSVKNIMIGKKRVSLQKDIANFEFTIDEINVILKMSSSIERVN